MKLKSILSVILLLIISNINAQDTLNQKKLVGSWEIIYELSEQVDTINFLEDFSWSTNNHKEGISSRKSDWRINGKIITFQYADKRDPNIFHWEIITNQNNTLEVIEKRYNNGEEKPILTKLILRKMFVPSCVYPERIPSAIQIVGKYAVKTINLKGYSIWCWTFNADGSIDIPYRESFYDKKGNYISIKAGPDPKREIKWIDKVKIKEVREWYNNTFPKKVIIYTLIFQTENELVFKTNDKKTIKLIKQ